MCGCGSSLSPRVMLQARRSPAKRKRSQSARKRPINDYVKEMLAARKSKVASFTYNGKKYSRTAAGLYKRVSPAKKHIQRKRK